MSEPQRNDIGRAIYWIDPADCGEPMDLLARFVERVRIALPADWDVAIVGGSDEARDPSAKVPPEIESIADICWEDHQRYDGDPKTRILLTGEHRNA